MKRFYSNTKWPQDGAVRQVASLRSTLSVRSLLFMFQNAKNIVLVFLICLFSTYVLHMLVIVILVLVYSCNRE